MEQVSVCIAPSQDSSGIPSYQYSTALHTGTHTNPLPPHKHSHKPCGGDKAVIATRLTATAFTSQLTCYQRNPAFPFAVSLYTYTQTSLSENLSLSVSH